MKKFSQKLKNRLIDYFKQTYGLEITSDQAEIYLDSLADFYFAISEKGKDRRTLFEKRASVFFFTQYFFCRKIKRRY